MKLYIPNGINEKIALDSTTHLAISAHQDDIEFMAYQAIAKCYDSDEYNFSAVVVTNGSFELASDGLLKVSYLENDADLRPGDVILTNGGAYPPDLIIGKVEEFRQESHGISSYASVRPAVDISQLSTVLVIKDFHVEN